MKRLLSAVFLCSILSSQSRDLDLEIERVMTAKELAETGVSSLAPQQREALNRWLTSFTLRVLKAGQPHSQSPRPAPSGRSPAIESTIAGEFHGWEGETLFKLDNGQIWQQAEYDYMYSYSYRPEVTIYPTTGGCKLKVEDEEETIFVRRIK